MDRDTRRRLDELNGRFYSERAAVFGQTRDHPWPGWDRVLDHVSKSTATAELHVLDVGCGNGRFGAFLATAETPSVYYTGVDRSDELLLQARSRLAETRLADVRLLSIDAVADADALPPGPFDLIALFGLLHHVPGQSTRDELLVRMASRLASGGLLALTVWRFGESERFATRRIAWEDYNASADEPVDPTQLEPGDHLLAFGAEGPPRYCHHMSDSELARLATTAGLLHEDDYRADGKSGDLNHYVLLRRP